MKALDPHRVTTVTDPTIDGAVVEGLELVVVLVDEGALDFLRDGTIDDTLVGTIVVVADFAMVGFTVGVVLVEIGVATIDGAVVEGLELVVVLVDEGALDFLRDGTVDDTLVGTIVVVADFAMVGSTVGLVKLGEAIIEGLNDEPLDVGKSVVLIAVDC